MPRNMSSRRGHARPEVAPSHSDAKKGRIASASTLKDPDTISRLLALLIGIIILFVGIVGAVMLYPSGDAHGLTREQKAQLLIDRIGHDPDVLAASATPFVFDARHLATYDPETAAHELGISEDLFVELEDRSLYADRVDLLASNMSALQPSTSSIAPGQLGDMNGVVVERPCSILLTDGEAHLAVLRLTLLEVQRGVV